MDAVAVQMAPAAQKHKKLNILRIVHGSCDSMWQYGDHRSEIVCTIAHCWTLAGRFKWSFQFASKYGIESMVFTLVKNHSLRDPGEITMPSTIAQRQTRTSKHSLQHSMGHACDAT